MSPVALKSVSTPPALVEFVNLSISMILECCRIGWLNGNSAIIRDAGDSNLLGRAVDTVDQQILGAPTTGLSLTTV